MRVTPRDKFGQGCKISSPDKLRSFCDRFAFVLRSFCDRFAIVLRSYFLITLNQNPRTYVWKAWPLKGGIHCSLRSQCCPLCQHYTFNKKSDRKTIAKRTQNERKTIAKRSQNDRKHYDDRNITFL